MNTYTGNSISASMENSRNSLRRIARHDDTEFSNQSILNAMDQFVRSVSAMDETILVPCRLMDLKVGDADDTTAQTAKKTDGNTAAKQQMAAKAGGGNNGGVGTVLNGADLFDMYNMLHAIKGQLLWGQEGQEGQDGGMVEDARTATYAEKAATTPATQLPSTIPDILTPPPPTAATPQGHVRRPSTVSVSSASSATSSTSTSSSSTGHLSDTESDLGNENDSGIDDAVTKAQSSSAVSTTSSSEDAGTAGGVASVDRTQLVSGNFRRHLAGLQRSLRQMTDTAQYLTKRYQHDIGGGQV